MDQETEYAFLAAAMLGNREAIPHLDLPPQAFTDAQARAGYEALRKLLTEGQSADSVSVAQLANDPSLMRLPVETWGVPSAIGSYAQQLRRAHKARQVRRLCQKAMGEAGERNSDPDEITGRMMTALTELSRSSVGWEHSAAELAAGAAERIMRAAETRAEGGTVGVPFGMKRLDEGIGGMHPGHLIVVGARPKMGKTALMNSIALNATRSGHGVGMISAEMPAEQITDRLISSLSGISYQALRSGEIDHHQSGDVSKAASTLERRPLWVMDQPGCSIGDVLRQARAWHMRHGIDVLFVDHLLRLKTERHDRRDLELNDMVRSLKTLAGELGITVVLFSQLNRGVEQRADPRPRMSDLREAGAAEEEADTVLMLYREAAYSEDADEEAGEIIVEANRHGWTGVVPMRWMPERMLWIDPDLHEYEGVSTIGRVA